MRRLLCLSLAVLPALAAAQPKPPDTFLTPEAAGPDFLVQGEYRGGDWAAQVVAEGKGRFAVVFLAGGLPGEGWDGKTRQKAAAKTEDGRTLIEGGGWKGEIRDGALSASGPGDLKAALRRVERRSPTEGLAAPPGAVVLFDGRGVTEWAGAKATDDGLLAPGGTTRRAFADCKLHVEFRLPFKPAARGQSRGNSGVYLQRRYEIQILDSFGLEPRANDCAAVYEATAPSVNACFPPLSWQTYDIDFTAARWEGGKKVRNAAVTVRHNGVTVHDRVAIKGPTGHGIKEADDPQPLNLQSHGNPVHFRNVWLVEVKGP